jgi:hypothetical protein
VTGPSVSRAYRVAAKRLSGCCKAQRQDSQSEQAQATVLRFTSPDRHESFRYKTTFNLMYDTVPNCIHTSPNLRPHTNNLN